MTKRKPATVQHYHNTVEIVDPVLVHMAIAAGELPSDIAPIRLDNAKRWAARQQPGVVHGVKIEKEGVVERKN